MSPSLLRLLSAVLGVLVVAGIAGCGTSGAQPKESSRSLDRPVRVSHRYGVTEVKSVPKRIVTVDLQWTDVMLAMGVEPVGYTVDPLMPKAGVPWQRLPAKAKRLSVQGGLPIGKIAELKPDLIVGDYSIEDKRTYQLLSEIAPTLATPDTRQVARWQDLVRTAGKVLDEPEQATEVIDSVDGKVAAVAKELPGLKGKTFALAQYIVGSNVTIVADEKDGSSVFFQDLGMTLYPPLVRAGKKNGTARVTVSVERADLLRSDLLAFLVNGGDRSDLDDIPGFDELPGTVAILDYPTIVGLNTPTPLSIPYALKQLRPNLEKTANA